MFDYAIVGAGAAGVVLALKLKEKGRSVKLYDKDGVLEGASSVAGAFFSPKLGKNYPLDKLINSSLLHSLRFFETHFFDCLDKRGVLMLPKKSKGGEEKFREYEEYIELPFEIKESGDLLKQREEGYFFKDGAILDVWKLKKKIENTIEFEQKNIDSYSKIEAKNIILTTGVQTELLPEYIDITPVYGHRLECLSEQECGFNLNGDISLSATRKRGSFAIGATHHRSQEEYKKDGGKKLIKSAKELLGFEFKIENILGGARATSKDHFPIIGRVADVDEVRKLDSRYLHSKRWSSEKLKYIDGVYLLNGLGARGFVYAPLCADILIEHIEKKSPIPRELDSDRLLFRYFRKR
ncbi:MAG: FAD-dependent oxidoreductase [Campylobacterales bacterium]